MESAGVIEASHKAPFRRHVRHPRHRVHGQRDVLEKLVEWPGIVGEARFGLFHREGHDQPGSVRAGRPSIVAPFRHAAARDKSLHLCVDEPDEIGWDAVADFGLSESSGLVRLVRG